MSNEISKKISEDMVDHSIAVIRYIESQRLPKSVVDQLTRAVTSVGANYTEAQDSASKKDFANKIFIAKKESAETSYWLRFVEKYCGITDELQKLHDDTQKFTMILQKILTSLRSPS